MAPPVAAIATDSGVWKSLLAECRRRGTNFEPKNLVVLGDVGCGVGTLIRHLGRRKGSSSDVYDRARRKGIALEYAYINVASLDECEGDDEAEAVARINVWQLRDTSHCDLLRLLFKSDLVLLRNVAVLVSVDFSKPWTMMAQLNTWFGILEKTIQDTMASMGDSGASLQSLQKKERLFYQNYVEPVVLSESQVGRERSMSSPLKPADLAADPALVSLADSTIRSLKPKDDEEELLPLEDGVLTHNLGIPIFVVCNKADAAAELEKSLGYKDSHFDFIQHRLRQFCQSYGAALMYVSLKEGKNVDLLYRYLVHRFYGMDFSFKAQVLEKDSIFVPTGYDSPEKLTILIDKSRQNVLFEEGIPRPEDRRRGGITVATSSIKPSSKEPLTVQGEDDDIFYGRMKEIVDQSSQSGGQRAAKRISNIKDPAVKDASVPSASHPSTPIVASSLPKTPITVKSQPPVTPPLSGTAVSSTPLSATSNAMLSTFFESLMQGGGSATPVSDTGAATDSVRKNVEDLVKGTPPVKK